MKLKRVVLVFIIVGMMVLLSCAANRNYRYNQCPTFSNKTNTFESPLKRG
ncbi:MAG: hypothetical protein PHR81_05655 [Bacteroidales bacterium]|nr:hypothetical protein [Bacteroidales bacterium]MDD4214277.1 hypothetical protein [Bacteroidales bacterium]